ncbi:hypothetical protein BDD12DRAFT_896905 [Trichophaea hybrida]|nr:hypothetical protein BDD12DRAFT_896905 [Trichophaea hybrida]
MTVGDGGCRPGTAKTPSSADNGRPAVIHMLGRDGRSWRRPVRPGKVSDGTAVPGRRTGRLRSLSNLIDRCLVYESVHLKEDTDASRILKKTILKLYITILNILAVEELSQTLSNVERLENALERDANAAGAQWTAVGLKDIQTFLEELHPASTRLQENLGNINHMLKVNDRTKILEWTSTIPYTSYHQLISRQRLEGTGEWILARNEYRDWRTSYKRIDLLKSLKLVIEKLKNLVTIFATSRNDLDILHQFGMFPRIDVQPDDNAKDIREFIQSNVAHAIDDAQLLQGHVSEDLRMEICDALGTRSKGIFQLAAVQITFLCQLDTDGDVRTSLNNLLDSLKKAYYGITNQRGSSPRLALNAFRWVKYSYELLASNTLLNAVRAQVSDSGDHSQHGPITTNTILKICQNLLIWDEPLDTVRFAHFSMREYLETKFTEADCHTYITKICLSLLYSSNDCERYD